jgi:hypothetical protein
MTNITDPQILAKLAEGRCPYCDSLMLEGPHGGLSINVECDDCGAKFNLQGPKAELGAQLLNPPTNHGAV